MVMAGRANRGDRRWGSLVRVEATMASNSAQRRGQFGVSRGALASTGDGDSLQSYTKCYNILR
jgi:hypothetical protein